jgi:hypothetical protein
MGGFRRDADAAVRVGVEQRQDVPAEIQTLQLWIFNP